MKSSSAMLETWGHCSGVPGSPAVTIVRCLDADSHEGGIEQVASQNLGDQHKRECRVGQSVYQAQPPCAILRERVRGHECIRFLLNVRPIGVPALRVSSLPNRHIIPPDIPISPDRVIYPASESICSGQRGQMERVDGGFACRFDARLVRHGMWGLRRQRNAVRADGIRPDFDAQNWHFPRICRLRLRQARLTQTTQVLILTLA